MAQTPSRHEHRPLATPTRQVETERAIVTEWRFPPGGRTGWHVHAYDYVVVPMTTGTLLSCDGELDHRADLVSGVSYARPRGVAHDVINDNPFEFVFVEIEVLP